MEQGNPVITLRNAEFGDCRLIYSWRNQPSVRKYFFDSQEIPFEVHENWFRESLDKEGRFLLVALLEETPLGVIRFDVLHGEPEAAEVDIYLAPEMHGRGLGTRLLEAGEKWAFNHTEIRSLRAKVKEENAASVRMFKKRGFGVAFIEFSKEIGREST